ncbi:MAG: hypothetical protein DMF87_06525 [Acidobacteria bacterium]|nr:MAG: hypothetical protein DMF87_06525 [Acidobacteriota bacterium]
MPAWADRTAPKPSAATTSEPRTTNPRTTDQNVTLKPNCIVLFSPAVRCLYGGLCSCVVMVQFGRLKTLNAVVRVAEEP